MSAAESRLALLLDAHGLGGYVREHQFARGLADCPECGDGPNPGYVPGWKKPGSVPGWKRAWKRCPRRCDKGAVMAGRKWALDFAWAAQRVAVELHGGVHHAGAHARGWGVTRDAEKLRAAALRGWLVLPYTTHEAGVSRAKPTKADGEAQAACMAEIRSALEMRR